MLYLFVRTRVPMNGTNGTIGSDCNTMHGINRLLRAIVDIAIVWPYQLVHVYVQIY
jgi:hypothetical protein